MILLLGGSVACGPSPEPPIDSDGDTSTGPGPGPGPGTGPGTLPDPGTTTMASSSGPDLDSTEGPMLDVAPPPPPPPPGTCPDDSGELVPLWTISDPAFDRADTVAAGAGMVAWTLGGFGDYALRVVDPEGGLLWEQGPLALSPGWAEMALQGLAIGPDGDVVLAATIDGIGGFDAALYWYDANGSLEGTDTFASMDFDLWQGVAFLPNGDVIAAGESGEDMLVSRYVAGAIEAWTHSYDGPGQVWSSDVAVTPDGLALVSGHSNMIPGPVLRAYQVDGSEAWTHLAPGTESFEIARDVASDARGQAWLAVQGDPPLPSRVERFDPSGVSQESIELDFRPNAIEVAPDGSIVIGGDIIQSDLVVVERRAPDWTQLARYERDGQWLIDMAIDEQCHTYIALGEGAPGATLEKLD